MKKLLLIPLFLFLILLAGCGGGPSPEDTVSGYLKALQAFDLETANTYLVTPIEDTDIEGSEATIVQGVLENTDYQDVTLIAEEESSATVQVTITGPDMAVLLEEATKLVFEKALSSESEMNENDMEALLIDYFTQSLDDPELITTTETVSIPLKKLDDTWKITDEGTTAISYGILGSLANTEF